MKETGYEWDAEKKELRTIEQNHTDNIEPKFKVGDIISYGISEAKIVSIDKNKYNVIDSKIENDTHICNLVVYFKDQEKWKLVEYKSEENKKYPQSKQEWSEEDDSMIEGIKIAILDYYDKENADEIISWLESIKERVQPQPKYQWKPSKEQMEALNAINNIGELSYVEQSDLLVKLYNDLKKL